MLVEDDQQDNNDVQQKQLEESEPDDVMANGNGNAFA